MVKRSRGKEVKAKVEVERKGKKKSSK